MRGSTTLVPGPPRQPETGAGPLEPFAVTPVIVGGLAVVSGLWGLQRPEHPAAVGEAVANDTGLRLGAALLVWLAMVALAGYVTARWESLRWWQGVAGWILVMWLWVGGMVALRTPIEPHQMVLGRVLEGGVAAWGAGPVGVLAGIALLALAATAWREQRAEAAGRAEARRRLEPARSPHCHDPPRPEVGPTLHATGRTIRDFLLSGGMPWRSSGTCRPGRCWCSRCSPRRS
jgi:hypothetical protein